LFLVVHHSLFLAPFVAGDIKYFRIWGGVAPGGGNIFLKKIHPILIS